MVKYMSMDPGQGQKSPWVKIHSKPLTFIKSSINGSGELMKYLMSASYHPHEIDVLAKRTKKLFDIVPSMNGY